MDMRITAWYVNSHERCHVCGASAEFLVEGYIIAPFCRQCLNLLESRVGRIKDLVEQKVHCHNPNHEVELKKCIYHPT